MYFCILSAIFAREDDAVVVAAAAASVVFVVDAAAATCIALTIKNVAKIAIATVVAVRVVVLTINISPPYLGHGQLNKLYSVSE